MPRRPKTLNDLDTLTASGRVGDYLVPQEAGEWSIRPFHVDESAATVDRLRAFGDGGGRFTPEGHYLMLRNGRGVMMSNTPDELTDHAAFMEAAEGRVLVTGLGLSCVVSGLLANDKVTHIDVVELSEDVIKMVGPSFDDEPRVTIHQGDAFTYEWPADARWDFAWHDIWQTISSDNLVTGDHNCACVGYDQMLQRYAPHVTKHQGAWGLDTSLLMEAAQDLATEQADDWAHRWRVADENGRREILIDWFMQVNPVMKALGGEPTQQRREVAEWMLEQENWRERVKKPEASFYVEAPPLVAEVRDKLPGLMYAYFGSLDLPTEPYPGEDQCRQPVSEPTT